MVHVIIMITPSLALFDNVSHSFGFISDLHYAIRDPTTRYYSDSVEKARAAVNYFNNWNQREIPRLDFVLVNGDFKDLNMEDQDPRERAIFYLTEIEKELRAYNGDIYHTLGNHDIDLLTKQEFLDRVTNSGIPPEQGRYYSFNHGSVHYVVLDANFYPDGKDHSFTETDPSYQWNNCYISSQELTWLKNDLENSRNQNVIVFVHQRIDESIPGTDQDDHTVKNAWQARELLEAHQGVLAVFQGHQHDAYGSPASKNGIYYYTIKASVEGPYPENNSYAIINILNNCTLNIVGFGNAVSVSLPQIAPNCFQ